MLCTKYLMYFPLYLQYQWGPMGGKCGVCGDPYDGPLENQPGDDSK